MKQPKPIKTTPVSKSASLFAFHPILLGMYPFLALLANNFSQVVPVLTLRAFLVTLAIVLICFWLTRKFIRDKNRAAALLSLFFVFFFTYGHLYTLLEGKILFGILVGRHLLLAPFWLVLFSLITWWIMRKQSDWQPITKILNGVSVLLVVFAIFQISLSVQQTPSERVPTKVVTPSSQNTSNTPDVYYIILDAYTRQDMLLKNHSLDTSAFVTEMQELGFVFPPCTQSNYSITALSLSSSLNMNYVEAFAPEIVAQNINWGAFSDFIIQSEVRRQFEQLGYSTVSFETGIAWDEITDADYYLVRQKSPFLQMLNFKQITGFEILYLRTTALRIIDESRAWFGVEIASNIQSPQQDHYERILFVLDQLKHIHDIPGPKFVFLHMMIPHGPWVFSPTGEYSFTNDEISGYANSVQFLNSVVPTVLQSIIEQSEQQPIIIIQGDHGYLNEERMAILNAYYLPGNVSEELYPRISPVNTFRLIFNTYFGANYELLPDYSYLSDRDIPYDYEEITYTCTVSP